MFVEQIGQTTLVNPTECQNSCRIWYVNDLQTGALDLLTLSIYKYEELWRIQGYLIEQTQINLLLSHRKLNFSTPKIIVLRSS